MFYSVFHSRTIGSPANTNTFPSVLIESSVIYNAIRSKTIDSLVKCNIFHSETIGFPVNCDAFHPELVNCAMIFNAIQSNNTQSTVM